MSTMTAMLGAPVLATAARSPVRACVRPVSVPSSLLVSRGVVQLKSAAPALRVSRPVRALVVASSGSTTYELAPEGPRDYTPVLGILAFVASLQGRLDVTASLLLRSLAILQLAVAASQVSTNRSFGDTVSAVVSPAVLATAVLHLSNWSYMQTANVLFGYYVAEKLEGPFWVWMATLAGAMYAGYGLEWYTAAFALWQGTRLVRGSQDDKVPLLTIPGLAAAAYAFWKGHSQLLAVALFIAHTIGSGLGLLEEVTEKNK